MNTSKIATAARWIHKAEHILVFCGSGLSAESGVPTFRGENGLYNDSKLLEYAHADALTDSPDEALTWFQEVIGTLDELRPNAGHFALARICQNHPCTIVTQNVDRLLENAIDQSPGDTHVDPLRVWHLHGSLYHAKCLDCAAPIKKTPAALAQARCPECGGRVRPDVVLFGEELPEDAYRQAQGAAHVADLLLLLGTSGIVNPAALLPGLARSHGAKLIEINPNPTELTPLAHLTLRGPTGELLPAIEKLLR